MKFYRINISSMVMAVMMLLVFSFAAVLEYNHEVESNQESLQEEIVNVKTNIESMISSRIINANGMASVVELSKGLDENYFEVFAKGIYDHENQVVKDVVMITDTVITDVYPKEFGEDAIGVDLALIPEQRELLLYSKEFYKTVFFGPVDLVEGGQGIIVRVPVLVNGAYYGQLAIVYDFESFLVESGLLSLGDENIIILEGIDPIHESKSIIWQNGRDTDSDFVYENIKLKDIEWTLR